MSGYSLPKFSSCGVEQPERDSYAASIRFFLRLDLAQRRLNLQNAVSVLGIDGVRVDFVRNIEPHMLELWSFLSELALGSTLDGAPTTWVHR